MVTPMDVAKASQCTYLKIRERINPYFYIDDILMYDEFIFVANLSEDTTIGVSTLQKWRIKLDFEHDTVIIDSKISKAILKQLK